MLDDKDGAAGRVLYDSLDVEAARAAVLTLIEQAAQIKQTSVVYPVGFPQELRLTQEQRGEGVVEGPDYEP